jgi:thiol-disulfide isomerase/thioredoxin
MRLQAALLLAALGGPVCANPQGVAPLLKPLNLVEYRTATRTPGFDGSTLEGRRMSLGALRGRVVLVNFWASWCAECRPEMPALERLHREFGAQGLSVVGVNFREDRETVGRYAKQLGLSFPLVLDPAGAIGTDYGVFGLPATFLVGRDGRAVAFGVGIRDWEGPEAKTLIRGLLAEAAPDSTGHGAAVAQKALVIKPLAEKKVAALPNGPLFWRIENFASRGAAQAASGDWSLVAEAAGKVWLFTLGPPGGASQGGDKVAEVGPIPRVAAPQYLLRINEAGGAPGGITSVHSHPGSEAFFVLSGEQSIRSPRGVTRIAAGKAEAGRGADVAMQVSSSGSSDLHALVMFVVDGTRPFSSPAKLPPP